MASHICFSRLWIPLFRRLPLLARFAISRRRPSLPGSSRRLQVVFDFTHYYFCWVLETATLPLPSAGYNPLQEPSPLGLQLKKSPSFLDLIQMKLSEENANLRKRKLKGDADSASNDKLKASNFPASLLRIGTWEYKSRYEGDLVGK